MKRKKQVIYAIFDKDVSAKDKYEAVKSKMALFYDKKTAKKYLDMLCRVRNLKKSHFKILTLDYDRLMRSRLLNGKSIYGRIK